MRHDGMTDCIAHDTNVFSLCERRKESAAAYPQYRVVEWGDTRQDAMNRPQPTILYGIQIRLEPRGKWMHCSIGTQPMIYDTPAQARYAIAELKAGDAHAA